MGDCVDCQPAAGRGKPVDVAHQHMVLTEAVADFVTEH
jgi:hypothetical protein